MYKCPSCGAESPNPGRCDGCKINLERKCDVCGCVKDECDCGE